MLQRQLLTRREKLRAALPGVARPEPLVQLLQQLDAALERMEAGTYGICDTCHDTIETERLLADPLCRNCLDHLSAAEQRSLERDLDLAYQIQSGLLPKPGRAAQGWTMAYHYEPVGPVSGDYCDLITLDDGTGLFLLGDVTGKGVAASLLMAHLHATFRSLTHAPLRVDELVSRANRVFCEGIPASHFATLVCGRLGRDGEIEICNAGHCYPLHVQDGHVTLVESTGLPLGLFCDGEYASRRVTLSPGDSLVVYSDGLSEALNRAGEEYGVDRLAASLPARRGLAAPEVLAALLQDVGTFRAGAARTDDLTVMVIRREAA
jgi:sigma-B regulation protein RsbU (phosphoserine phosphatase)